MLLTSYKSDRSLDKHVFQLNATIKFGVC